jgi:RNA polymerase sigma factor (sigma-70 family)
MGETAHSPDGELLARVAADGSQECFEELVRRHGRMVLGVCRRQLDNGHDAEDAAQAVFLVLWQKASSLRRHASVAGWLHHVVCNVCRNARKAKRIRAAREREAAEMIARSGQQAEWNAMKDLLDDELDGLPEKYRLPIVLFHLEGRSLEETAALLCAKVSTVTTRLSRGREKLRQRLSRHGVIVPAAVFPGALSRETSMAGMPLFFAEKTAKAVCLHAVGQAGVGGLVSGQAAALAKGAMHMFPLRKLYVAVAVLIATGFGTVVTFAVVQHFGQGGRIVAGEQAVKSEPVDRVSSNPKLGGAPVKGLRLSLTADKNETTMLPDGSNALPVKFTVTFTNVGDKPLKLDAWDLPDDGDKLKITVAGPEGGVDIKDIRPLIRRRRPPRKLAAFPILAKSGGHQVGFSSQGIKPYFQIRLRKPGEYRFKVVYQSREQQYPEKFAQGYWIGSVASNEFVLTVRPPAKAKELQPAEKKRLQALKGSLDTFRLYLLYQGAELRDGHEHLVLNAAKQKIDINNGKIDIKSAQLLWALQGAVNLKRVTQVQLTREQANNLVDGLAREGFLKTCSEGYAEILDVAAPCYVLRIGNKNQKLYQALGSLLPNSAEKQLQQLKKLRGLLEGDAAKAMDRILAALRTQMTRTPLITMHRRPGMGPQANQNCLDFVVSSDGRFRYDKLTGKLPQMAIDKLRQEIAKAEVGSGAEGEGADTFTFRWWDKHGKRHGKIFTNPAAPDCKRLLETIAELAHKHANKQNSPPRPEMVREILVRIEFNRPMPGQLPIEGIKRIASDKEARTWLTPETVTRISKVLDFATEDLIIVKYLKGGVARFLKHKVDKDKANTVVHFFTTRPAGPRSDRVATQFFAVPGNAKVRFSNRPDAVHAEPKPIECVGHAGAVVSVAVSPDGKLVASGSDDQTLRFWNAADGKLIRTVLAADPPVKGGWVGAVTFTPDGETVVANTHTGAESLQWYNTESGKPAVGRTPLKDGAYGVAFSPDGNLLAAANNDWVRVYDLAKGNKLHEFTFNRKQIGRAWRVAFTPDGKYLAAALENYGYREQVGPLVRIWDLATGKEVFREWEKSAHARAVAFSPNGKMLAAGGEDNGIVEVYDWAAKKWIARFQADARVVFCLAFSPDGKKLYTGGNDPEVKVWNTTTFKAAGKLVGHTDQVADLALSQDGTVLATAGRDGRVLIWHLGAKKK